MVHETVWGYQRYYEHQDIGKQRKKPFIMSLKTWRVDRSTGWRGQEHGMVWTVVATGSVNSRG